MKHLCIAGLYTNLLVPHSAVQRTHSLLNLDLHWLGVILNLPIKFPDDSQNNSPLCRVIPLKTADKKMKFSHFYRHMTGKPLENTEREYNFSYLEYRRKSKQLYYETSCKHQQHFFVGFISVKLKPKRSCACSHTNTEIRRPTAAYTTQVSALIF